MKKLVGMAIIAALAAFLVLLSYFVLADSHEPWRSGKSGGGSAPIPVPKEKGIPIPDSGNSSNYSGNVTPVPGVPLLTEEATTIRSSVTYSNEGGVKSGVPGVEVESVPATGVVSDPNHSVSVTGSGSESGSEGFPLEGVPALMMVPDVVSGQEEQKGADGTGNLPAASGSQDQDQQQSLFAVVRDFFRRLFG